MPTVLRTDPTDLLTRIIARLLAKEVVRSDAAVIVTAVPPEDVPHHIAPHDVLLWPQDEASDGNDDSAGRVDTRAVARLFIVARSRVLLDKAGSDRQSLTHASLGHYQHREAIRNALQIFWP